MSTRVTNPFTFGISNDGFVPSPFPAPLLPEGGQDGVQHEADQADRDEQDDTTTDESSTEGAESNGEGESQGGSDDDGADDDGDDLSPDVLRKELKSVRSEAAKYRKRLRDAEARLAEAKTPEDVEKAVTELREQNARLERELTREKVARKFGLPDELAVRLQGNTEDEMAADAKSLQRYVRPSTPEQLGGGLDPSNSGDTDATNPRELARSIRRF